MQHSTSAAQSEPVPSNKFLKYAEKQHNYKVSDAPNLRYEAYQSLLDNRIRSAWVSYTASLSIGHVSASSFHVSPSASCLRAYKIPQLHALYLTPSNFAAVATPLYIDPTSSSLAVRLTIARQLRIAASAELLKSSHSKRIDIEELYREADKAWEALDSLLGDDDWFFGESEAGLFDAGVFAYTHLILGFDVEGGLTWADRRVAAGLRWKGGLVKHQERMLAMFYGEEI